MQCMWSTMCSGKLSVKSFAITGGTVLQEIVWLVRNNADVEKSQTIPNVERVPYLDISAELSGQYSVHRFYEITISQHSSWNYIANCQLCICILSINCSFFVGHDASEIIASLPPPRIMKTHVQYGRLPSSVHQFKTKVICPLRNPKDVLVSAYNFYRMNGLLGSFKGSWDDFFEYFEESGHQIVYGNPVNHMLEYWKHRNDPNVLIVFYEDIVLKRVEVVKKVAGFFNVDLSQDQIKKITEATSFNTMKASPMTNQDMMQKNAPVKWLDTEISSFMRKGKIGDWKNNFNEEQSRIIDQMCEEKLKGTGLNFMYE